MRIILFNNCWPTTERPTEGTYVKTIAETLKETGVEVEVCAMCRKRNKWIDYILFHCRLALKPLPKDSVLYINHYVFLFPLIMRLLFIHRRCIFHWHGEELIANGKIIRFLRWIMSKTFQIDAVHISPSRYYANTVICKKLRIPESKIVISPSGGVDTDVFCGNMRLIEEASTVHIGYSAALSQHKGMLLLMNLIANKKELELKLRHKVHFHIIEYGKELNVFKNFISQSKMDCITLYPSFNKNEMPNFYKNVHLLLFLSKRESLGLTVIESMACGVPVLAKNTCAMPEIVLPRVTGELVSENPTTEELLDKLALMVVHFKEYQPRKFIIQRYSRESVVSGYKNILSL